MISIIPNPTLCIKNLIAGNGDCVLISFRNQTEGTSNILIDGGNGIANYKEHIQPVLEQVVRNGQKLDLVVITHIDQDHIKGIVYLTRDLKKSESTIQPKDIVKYWFNSALNEKIYQVSPEQFDVSAAEMKELEEFLHKQPDVKWDIKDKIESPWVKNINGAILSVLSPNTNVLTQFNETYNPNDIGSYSNDYDHSLETLYTAEKVRLKNNDEDLDDKLENATSIAFLLEHKKNSILYLGDGIPAVVDSAIEELLNKRNLERLTLDVVKLSHHASRKSLSFKLLKLIDCKNFVICANGKKARLPNKATFAKILCHPHRNIDDHIKFHFNYPDFSKLLKFTDQEKKDLNFSCADANFEHGYCLTLPIKP